MSFLGFIGQIIPWSRQKSVGEGGFGAMLERLKPWGKKAETETATAGGGESGGDKGLGGGPGTPNDDWLLSSSWLHVASSNVEAIRYLYDDRILETEFKDGSFYQYYNVPPETASDMHDTSSPGRFVWQRLRDRFPYVKLTGVSSKMKRKPSVIRTPTPKEMATKWKGVVPKLGLKPPWQR